MREVPGLFTLVLHTHLPWLAHHGRWPVGEEWLYQSWSAAYLPLMRVLRTLADASWPADLLADVASVRTDDFELLDTSARNIDESLDLVAIAVRP